MAPPAGSTVGSGVSRVATRSAITGAGTYPSTRMTADPHDNRAFLEAARAQIEGAREPRAGAPGPDADALRRAYLRC